MGLPFREPLFGLVRIVGIGFGLSAFVWGALEVPPHRRQLVPEYALPVAMAASIVFGAWLAALASVSPTACTEAGGFFEGAPVRCAD